jgi:succinyl-CoA synthetase alpha subunit
VAILVDGETRLLVQGITGKEGAFHTARNKAYGTRVVAGVTPGKGGQFVGGIPVYDTVAEAVEASGADASLIFVPARFAADALYEAAGAGIGLAVLVTEGVPVQDMARAVNYLNGSHTVLVGGNCPGVISPGKANVGIIPGEICTPGPVGLISRSGTLTYQIVHELTQRGIGQSTCLGMGGDPIHGVGFVDALERFQADPETRAVVLIGEIGGSDEEQAAAFISEHVTKPVVAYVAGFSAPPGKRMGHAGAIITGSTGTAQAKAEAFEAAGVRVGRNPTEVAELMQAALTRPDAS